METLEYLAKQEYLGRGIILGKNPLGTEFIAYFVTGRSPSSRARFLKEEWDESDGVRTECTNQEELRKGTPELLIYKAIQRVGDLFVVSNGAQTTVIANEILQGSLRSPVEVLMRAQSKPHWVQERKDGKFTGNYIDLSSFEPDGPNFTPRISGILADGKGALSIVRKADNSENAERQYFEFPLIAGQGKFVSTYTGKNVPKGATIPSFRGEPFDFSLPELSPGNCDKEYANLVYGFLGPKTFEGLVSPGEDFRVGVSTVLIRRNPRPSLFPYTVNAQEPAKSS